MSRVTVEMRGKTCVTGLLAVLLGMALVLGAEQKAPPQPGSEQRDPARETPVFHSINVPWDEESLKASPPAADADYKSLYQHVPPNRFPDLRKRLNPTVKIGKAFEFRKIDHPVGEGNPTAYRFDMGPAGSPVEKGYVRVTRDDTFSWEKGWGWEGRPAADFLYTDPGSVSVRKRTDFELVQIQEQERSFAKRDKELNQRGPRRFDNAAPMQDFFLDDLSRDAVLNPGELVFKVALPNGRYAVTMIIGDVQLPRYGMDVYANGTLVASNIYTLETPWPQRVAFSVNVLRNNLRIALRANDSAFLEQCEVSAEPADYARTRLPYQLGAKGDHFIPFFGKWVNLHGPATQMAIAGISICPYKRPPIEMIRQQLSLSPEIKEQNALAGVAQFNAGDRIAAEKSFSRIPDSEYWLKAHAYLALAGHLETEIDEELRFVDAAVRHVERGFQGNPEDIAAQDLLRFLRMYRGGAAYSARQSMPSLQVTGLPRDPIVEQDSQARAFHRRKETALFTWARPGDILYSKALMRFARSLAAGDPPRGLLPYQAAEDAFLKLQDQEPGNRFSQYFLYGDMTGWQVPDYSRDTQGTPKWAVLIREAYNRLLDQAAWWGKNRGQKDGSIGGGWGDDVEIGQVWEILTLLNPDADPDATETARAIAEGVWWSGEIDRDTGFYDGIADVEHTAEWTGDSQPWLLAMDYGNPLYYERSLKTGKLMRDLWMGETPLKHLHFRSMVLGDKATGTEYGGVLDAEIDCPLNGRATASAYWDWWYSPVQGLDSLFTRWADAWLADSNRAENGKPAGIIPGPIGFHTDVLGGNHATVWRQGAPGAASYENPTYTAYIRALFGRMYKLTGDKKWLAPKAIQLTSKEALMDQFENVPDLGAETHLGDKYARLNEMELEHLLEIMRQTWPSVTSENANTDRIAMPGLNQVLDLLTGGDIEFGLDFIPMTLQKTSRNVAFMNLSSSEKSAKTIFYNFSDRAEPVHLCLWKLQVGAEHKVTVGVDANDDDQIDEVLQTMTYRHAHRGDAVELSIPPHKASVVEVTQTKPGNGMPKSIVDLALAQEDIDYRDGRLVITVHNIGNKKSGPFNIRVWQGEARKGQLLKTLSVKGLESPDDLEPRTVTESFEWALPQQASLQSPVQITVELDPEDKYYEITEQNNVKSRSFPYTKKSYQTPRLWKTLAKKHGLQQWDPFPPDFPKDEVR